MSARTGSVTVNSATVTWGWSRGRPRVTADCPLERVDDLVRALNIARSDIAVQAEEPSASHGIHPITSAIHRSRQFMEELINVGPREGRSNSR
jgi:hypothetical protein